MAFLGYFKDIWLNYHENLKFNIAVFRAIFDLSNKIALLILLRMYALYVEKKKQKIENWLKSDIFSSVYVGSACLSLS